MRKMDQIDVCAVAYLPVTTVLADLHRMVAEVSAVGVGSDRTTVGGSFSAWSDRLTSGQTAWVYTLEVFRSIAELMSFYESMERRGVVVRSVREPWFNNQEVSGPELLGHLFRLGEAIHGRLLPLSRGVARRDRPGAKELPAQTVIKVKTAIELRATRKMSVVSACRVAGCGVNAYYRYLKNEQ